MKKKRIDKRPETANKQERIGDWEGDTIVGKEKKIHILTNVERRITKEVYDKKHQEYQEKIEILEMEMSEH